MAKNSPTGDNRRIGAVKNRSQTYNPKTNQYVKRNADTGKFMDVKQDVIEHILEVKVFNNNILLVDRYSGEAVKIGEIKNGN